MHDRPTRKQPRSPQADPALGAVRSVLLVTFAVALIGMAIVGTLTLLISTSSQVPEQVFGSLLVAVGYAGVILAFVQGAVRGIGPRWFCLVAGIASISSAALLIADIWLQLPFRSWPATPTAFFLAGGLIAAWPSAVLLHRARWAPFATVAIAIACIASGAAILDLWTSSAGGSSGWTARGRLLTCLWIAVGASLQTGLLGMLRPGTVGRWLLGSAVTFGWLLAVLCGGMVWRGLVADPDWTRVLGALAILTACASLLAAVVSLAATGRSTSRSPDGPLISELELICPVCATSQRIKVGDDRCATCACRFQFRVTPADCPGCGYSLADLPERKCPECGVRF